MRNDDHDVRSWFRSERFITSGGRWFFLTREGTQEGPFNSQKEAAQEVILYIRKLSEEEINEEDN